MPRPGNELRSGSAIGVALLGALIASNSIAAGLHLAMAIGAGVFLAGAAAAGSIQEPPRMVPALEAARVQ